MPTSTTDSSTFLSSILFSGLILMNVTTPPPPNHPHPYRTILPISILCFTYIRLLCLINKDSVNKNLPTQENQHQKLITLLAVVFFFIIFNLPGIVLIIWELAVFFRIQTCQSFNEKTGYSTLNYIITDLGDKKCVIHLSPHIRRDPVL